MEEIVKAIRVVADASLDNDKALLNLIQALIDKVGILESKVEMLMDIHRLEENQ